MAAHFPPPQAAFMRRAIGRPGNTRWSKPAVPLGPALVRGDEVLAVAHNTVLQEQDPTCHAEINAIRLAARRLQSYDLSACQI